MIDFDCCWPTEQAPTLTFNVLKKEAAVPAEITIWSKTFFKNFLLFDWSLVPKTSLSFYFVNFYDWFRLLLAYWTGPYPWFQRFEKRSSRSSGKNDLVDDLFSRILDPRTHLSLILWLIYVVAHLFLLDCLRLLLALHSLHPGLNWKESGLQKRVLKSEKVLGRSPF